MNTTLCSYSRCPANPGHGSHPPGSSSQGAGQARMWISRTRDVDTAMWQARRRLQLATTRRPYVLICQRTLQAPASCRIVSTKGAVTVEAPAAVLLQTLARAQADPDGHLRWFSRGEMLARIALTRSGLINRRALVAMVHHLQRDLRKSATAGLVQLDAYRGLRLRDGPIGMIWCGAGPDSWRTEATESSNCRAEEGTRRPSSRISPDIEGGNRLRR